MTTPTDADLLNRYLQHRDDDAFAILVRKHGPMVFGACRRVTAHHHDAEDAFQACFLVLAARAETVRPKERLGAWLHGVAVRCARKARDARRRLGASDTLPEPTVLPSAVEPDLPPLIDDALAAIPETYRAAVVLCHLEGRSRSEAARELGWSEGTLSGRLHRALELLERRLSARGVTATGAAILAVLSARTASANVPAVLSESTCSAASLLSAGFTEPAGPAAALAKGVLRTMLFRKLKVAAALLLGVVGVGSFAVLNQLEARPSGERVTRKNAPVPERKQRWQEAHRLAHNGEVTALAVHGDQAATSETIGDVRLWDMQTGGLIETVREVKPGDSGIGQPVLLLRLSKGDVLHILFETERTQSLMRVDRTEGGRRQTTVGVAGLTDLSDDGRTWALRRKDAPAEISLRRNLLTDSNPLEYQLVSEADKKAVTHTAISADDTRIATTTADAVRVYPRVRAEDLKGKQLRKEDWHKKPTREFALPKGVKLTALKLSDDGKRLALIGEKGFARVFDADAGKELCELKGHDGTVNAVAFTPDGSQVATANGKVVRVFDAKSGKLLGEIKGHDDEVTCLAFAADGKRLVTGSKDKMAKVWELK